MSLLHFFCPLYCHANSSLCFVFFKAQSVDVSLCVSDFTPQAGVQGTSQAAMATRLAPRPLPHGKCTQSHERVLPHWSYSHKDVSVTHTAGRFSFPLNYTGFSAKGWRRAGRKGSAWQRGGSLQLGLRRKWPLALEIPLLSCSVTAITQKSLEIEIPPQNQSALDLFSTNCSVVWTAGIFQFDTIMICSFPSQTM